jgi:general secretion pathway protein C
MLSQMGLKDINNQWIKNIKSPTGKPPFEAFYIYILCAIIGYGIADLSVLNYRPNMLPTKAPPSKPPNLQRKKIINSGDIRMITQRNIFNNDGKIPPALTAGEEKDQNLDAPPTKTRLPLNLLGTIVHLNPEKSLATINKTSNNEVDSFRVGENIESLAQITKIERKKVIFRNLATRRLEYIDIPEDEINVSLKAPTAKKVSNESDVKKDGEFRFRISRDDLNKYTNDLPTIIKQARMVPNLVPNSGGKIDGFRFISIQPDSIFERLGFKPGDIIKGVNGEPVNSPTQAMEMYQSLKSSENLNLSVNRDGKDEVFDFTIE